MQQISIAGAYTTHVPFQGSVCSYQTIVVHPFFPSMAYHWKDDRRGKGTGGQASSSGKGKGGRAPSSGKGTAAGEGAAQGKAQQHKYPPEQVLRMPWPGTRMDTFPPVGQPGDWKSTLQAAEDLGLAPVLTSNILRFCFCFHFVCFLV